MTKDTCRACLREGKMLNIFQERDPVKISAKLISVTNIQIYQEDGLPSTICRKCVKKLDYCMAFIQLCKDSDTQLRTLILTNTPTLIAENFKQSFNEGLSPNSDATRDLMIDENTNQSHEDLVKEEEEITAPKNIYQNIEFNEKKKEKQQCFTCGKVMSSRFRLKTHLRTHTGERPFSCQICSKKFSLAQNLKVHLRTHTGEKPLSCPDCGATFAHSAGLAAHRRKHTGQTPYCCVLCPRSFRTVGHLQYHVRRHTGEKNFECDTCSRAFITRGDLKQHLVSHTGEKPHVCCVCGLRLTRASHLKRHMQFIHKGDKPLNSQSSDDKFLQKEDYETHKRYDTENVIEKIQ